MAGKQQEKEESKLEKLKQWFGVKGSSAVKVTGSTGSRRAVVKEYILDPHVTQEISKPNTAKHRLKHINQLCEVIQNKRLEQNGPEVLWECTKDLLKTQSAPEERRIMFRFLHCLIEGQYEQLQLMRLIFFRALQQDISLPEDAPYRLDLFHALTLGGKELELFEEETGDFLLELIQSLTGTKKLFELFNFMISVMKYNAVYLKEEAVSGIIRHTCKVASSATSDSEVEVCLHLLEATLPYCYIPSENLSQFIACLCCIVNRDRVAQQTWTLMRKLLETHLGHRAIFIMGHILQDKANAVPSHAPVLRGAIFFIGMALWGSNCVPSLRYPPATVLSGFLQALMMSNTLIVTLEVVLTVQRLVHKFGAELDSLTWDLILDVTEALVRSTQTDSITTANVIGGIHELISCIELRYEHSQFHGSTERLFSIVESCAGQRPENSMMNLIAYRVRHITPTQHDWLRSLSDVVEKYFVQNSRTAVRLKILEMLASVISTNSVLYRDDLVETVVLPHITGVDVETDATVRVKVIELIVDLAETCTSHHFFRLLDVVKKVIIPTPVVTKTSSSAAAAAGEETEAAVTGLVHVFSTKLYKPQTSHTVAAFEAIVTSTRHQLMSSAARHQQQTTASRSDTSVQHHSAASAGKTDAGIFRRQLIECLMSLRADTMHRVGLAVTGQDTQYSPFIVCHPREMSYRSSNKKTAAGGMECATTLAYTEAFHIIRLYIEQESEWSVLQCVLEQLPSVLRNKTIVSAASPRDVEKISARLCKLLYERSIHDSLVNIPPHITKSDFHASIFAVLSCLVSFHFLLDKIRQAELVHALEFGLVSKSSRMCIRALTVCAYEMHVAVMRQLPSLLLKLSQIHSTVSMAIPLMEFLSSLVHLPELYSSFVEEQYKFVFAIAIQYTNPFRYSHYAVSLAYHVIAMWFIKCRPPFKRGFVQYIVKCLEMNVLRQSEIGSSQRNRNQDSSDRNRTHSLNEEALRRKANRPSRQAHVAVSVDEPTSAAAMSPSAVQDQIVAETFHKELRETCIDMLIRYTYFNSSSLPKRSPVAKFLLEGGQTQSWLLGNSIVSVTTSGGARVGRSGLCEKCLSIARTVTGQEPPSSVAQDDVSSAAALRRRHRSEAVRTCRGEDGSVAVLKPLLTVSQDDIGLHRSPACVASQPASISSEDVELMGLDAKKKAMDDILISLKANPTDRSVFSPHVCNCWCTQWAEFHIRRPTGNFSWIVRLQNEQDLMAMFPDFALSDISNLFLPFSTGEDPEPSPSGDTDEMMNSSVTEDHESVASADSATSSELRSVCLSSSLRLEADCASSVVPDTEVVLNSSCELTPAPKTVSVADGVKLVSVADSAGKREPQWLSNSLSIVSEEAGLKSLSQGDRAGRQHSSSSSTTQGGMNPSFLFLQLYESQVHRCKSSHEPDDLLVPLPINESTEQSMKHLDMISPYETHKIGVIYIKPGQTKNELSILGNMHGSARYVAFIQKLGDVLRLTDCAPLKMYLGGLDHRGTDGPFVYSWRDEFMQVIFHITTLMPYHADDTHFTEKKKHIGNDNVTIVYNDSGEDYRMGTIKSQFNFVNIMIQPLDQGTNCVTVQTKPEIEDVIGHRDTKIISDVNLPYLVRQMAVHADLASMIYVRQKVSPMHPYASNWLERLRRIRQMHERLSAERAKTNTTTIHLTSKPCGDFTDFVK